MINVYVIIFLVIYIGIGVVAGRLCYQDNKPKKIPSKITKAELILNAIGVALAWGPLLLWISIIDVINDS